MVALCSEFEVQKDTFSQAGGWLRGNREGIEQLIDSTQTMLELIKNVRTPTHLPSMTAAPHTHLRRPIIEAMPSPFSLLQSLLMVAVCV